MRGTQYLILDLDAPITRSKLGFHDWFSHLFRYYTTATQEDQYKRQSRHTDTYHRDRDRSRSSDYSHRRRQRSRRSSPSHQRSRNADSYYSKASSKQSRGQKRRRRERSPSSSRSSWVSSQYYVDPIIRAHPCELSEILSVRLWQGVVSLVYESTEGLLHYFLRNSQFWTWIVIRLRNRRYDARSVSGWLLIACNLW